MKMTTFVFTIIFSTSLFAQLSDEKTEGFNYLYQLDQTRGYKDSGFTFDIVNISIRPDGEKKQNQLNVKVLEDKSLVHFLSPERVKGRALLKEGRNMWLHIPDTRRVIRVAPAQRLLGETSNGDVVGVNYSDNYSVESIADKTDSEHIILLLVANEKSAIYHKIKFWLKKESPYLPEKSEYYSLSNKLMKVAHYKEYKLFDGEQKLHKLLLVDPIREGHHTWMMFDNYRKTELSEQLFAKDALFHL